LAHYKNLILVLALSVLGSFVVYIGVDRVGFSAPSFDAGRQLIRLSTEQLRIIERKEVPLDGLRDPFGSSGTAKPNYPPVSLDEVVGAVGGMPAEQTTAVSMILLREGRKIAVVDDQVVGEGDFVEKSRVLRIEKDKVLLKNGDGRQKWVTLSEDMADSPGWTGQAKGGDRPFDRRLTEKGTRYDQDR